MAAAALLGSAICKESGLRLLLCPLGSNIVIRTACCSVGVALPVYSTYKAIENKDQNEQERWLVYWTVFGSFSLAEVFSDKILSWFPPYYYMKFAFLIWLQFPPYNGSRHFYSKHLLPFLLRYQSRLDQLFGYTSGEISKFLSANQAEIQSVAAFFKMLLVSGRQMAKNLIHPLQPQEHPMIESRSDGEENDPESDCD